MFRNTCNDTAKKCILQRSMYNLHTKYTYEIYVLYLVVHRVNFAMWLKQKKAVQKSPREKMQKNIHFITAFRFIACSFGFREVFFFLKFNFSRISQLYEIRNCIVCIIPCIHDLKQTNNKKNPKKCSQFWTKYRNFLSLYSS